VVLVLGAKAGLNLWVRLPGVPLGRDSGLIAAGHGGGVRVYSPLLFYRAPRQRPEAELVLGYASLSPEQIRSGIERFARVLGDFVPARRSGRGRRP
jgi:DNA-binding transcriptional MocR family regulator